MPMAGHLLIPAFSDGHREHRGPQRAAEAVLAGLWFWEVAETLNPNGEREREVDLFLEVGGRLVLGFASLGICIRWVGVCDLVFW